MVFKNSKIYDVLKWCCLVFSPALIALISGLGALYGFETSIICGTISLVTVFVGALIGVSANTYAKTQNVSSDENGAE